MTALTIRKGFGYWDITHYPYGGCFRRSDGTVTGEPTPQVTPRPDEITLETADRTLVVRRRHCDPQQVGIRRVLDRQIIDCPDYRLVVLVSSWGEEGPTEEECAAACDRMATQLAELAPETIDVDGDTYRLEIDDVRAPHYGEAEGTYRRDSDGTLQILGYSIPVPEGLGDLIADAWMHALETWVTP